jgi:hypothetical protein
MSAQNTSPSTPRLNDKGRMADIPLSPEAKITVGTVPRRRLNYPVPAGSRLGERHALHADRRPLGRRGGLPDGVIQRIAADPARALEAGIGN